MKKLISSALIATMLVTPLVSSTSFANEVKESKTHYAQDEKSFDSQKTGKIVACVAAGAATLTLATIATLKQIEDKLPESIKAKLSFFFNNKKRNTLNPESTFGNNSTTDIKPVIQDKKLAQILLQATRVQLRTHPTKEMNNTNPVTADTTINSVNIINKEEDDDDIDDIGKINNLKNAQKSSSGPIANLWAQIQAPVISAFASFITFCLLKFISRGQEVVAANLNPSSPIQWALFEEPTFAMFSPKQFEIPLTILAKFYGLSTEDIRIQLLQLYPDIRIGLREMLVGAIQDLSESDWAKIIPQPISTTTT